MRLFVALNLPVEERNRLYRAVTPLRRADLPMRWMEPDALHLTLKFLGEVADARVPAIESLLARVAVRHVPFRLELSGVGAFPAVRDPRVVWMGGNAAPELLALQRDVEREFVPLGFEPETRPFSPHLTIGRARRWAKAGDFRDFARMAESVKYEAVVAIESLDLMRSTLSPAGARYERLAAPALGAGNETRPPDPS